RSTAIDPLSPRDMRSWLRHHVEACHWAERRAECARAFTELEQQSLGLGETLRRALLEMGVETPPDETLTALFMRAREELAAVTELNQRRSALSSAILQQRAAIEESAEQRARRRAELDDWQARWAAAVSRLGLDPQAAPSEAAAMLDQLDQ